MIIYIILNSENYSPVQGTNSRLGINSILPFCRRYSLPYAPVPGDPEFYAGKIMLSRIPGGRVNLVPPLSFAYPKFQILEMINGPT